MLSFVEAFGETARVSGEAPGRVNLLGEHTDYTGGLVLPIGIWQSTRVEAAPSADHQFHVYSANLDERQVFVLGGPPGESYARYIQGCVEVLAQAGHRIPALNMRIESTVPMGVGLSSSAALEVAVLRALRQLANIALDDVQLALLAQRAETEFAGVHCGIMDQMASSLGDREHMLYLDTRSLEHRRIDLPADSEVLVLDSGSSRSLATTAYNHRRAECETAERLLGVSSLRDAQNLQQINALPEPLARRARHVVTENARVVKALTATAAQFGSLMNQSHASLRDDYEVSSPALDALVGALQRQSAVYGARLTGAGFGGACVALVRAGASDAVAKMALARFEQLGFSNGRSFAQPKLTA